MRLKNNSGSTSRIGYVVKISPSDPNSFIYATASDLQVLGICAESVPYRSECEIITGGVAKVFVSANVIRGDIIRNRKQGDTISNGSTTVARTGDAPYLQIGYATETGRGLINCTLQFKYLYSDGTSITWDDVTGKPTTFPPTNPTVRVVTDTTTELTTDDTIVCNKTTAMTVNLLAATGSGRVIVISNVNTGDVTVDGNSGDTINGETTQTVYNGCSMDIQDYALGKWIII